MRNTIKFIALFVMAGMLFTACDKVKDLADVKFDADFSTNLDIHSVADMKSTQGSFEASATINPLDNSDMATYANLIKEIKVNEITAEVLSISDAPVMLETAVFEISSDGFPSAVWEFENVELNQGTILTMDNSSGQFDNMQAILDSTNVFTAEISGTTDKDDVTFTLKVTIKTTVTANPLD